MLAVDTREGLRQQERLERRVPILQGYRPHRHQRALHALRTVAGRRFRVVVAGRRGGKTLACAADVVHAILVDYADKRSGRGRWAGSGPQRWMPDDGADPAPFLHYWVLAPVHALLEEPRVQLQRALGGTVRGGGLVLSQNRSTGTWWLPGGIRVDFRSCERPELLVSKGIDGLWVDEAARVKPSVWRDHLPAVLADRQGWGLFSTTPLGRNWVWTDLWSKGDPLAAEETGGKLSPQWAALRWRTVDNTAVPALQAEVKRQRQLLPAPMFRRNFEASFDAFVGQLLQLDPQLHLDTKVALAPHMLVDVVAGYDDGWTHPAVLTVWGRDRFGVWWELETVEQRELVVHAAQGPCWTRTARELRERWGFRVLHVPPEVPRVRHEFATAGLPVGVAHNARREGLDWWRVAAHNGEVRIRNPRTFRHLEALRHPHQGADAELWVKEDDDTWDAIRYALSDPIQRGRVAALAPVQINVLAR